ncbi:NAD(P)H-dependent oxidoreductase [Erythrobacter insulae]|uniref:NAD(P)H-dependent oxidoreductase n=1 Tax=Erythrobacter insulae TaxID=2584124 RepID=A0A547PCQ6_9SPHN|nr:NAD(P)H-dependent oxidoreductase [Erythrobacter insulae]TRD11905.1 NAD(P)H-dependent oxidoreductase [Erythrobacter insulae]
MRILAFAASNSSVSINQQLAAYAAGLAEGAEIEMLDIHDYEMPIYRHDREEAAGIPQLAHDFLAKVGSADALIISFAEHNGIYTAAFKNLFDWCSRVGRDVWQDKPMVLLSTSPGGRGGKGVLEFAAGHIPRFGGNLAGHMSVPSFGENFDVDAGKLIDAELDAQLKELIAALAS